MKNTYKIKHKHLSLNQNDINVCSQSADIKIWCDDAE